MDKVKRDGYSLYLTMNPLVKDILDKQDKLVDNYNDLKGAYHAEMSAVGGEIDELRKETKRLRRREKNGKEKST